ncbi:ROK family protein [Halobacteria archaeon AArc-dxtr1]|nr:ROK family protein [Halobacteria archaeon AArc-dxtr1]
MDAVATFGIGSTNFRGAVATPAGEFLTDVHVEPTRPQALQTQLCEAVATLRAQAPVDAVAITLPGLVDPDAGVVREFDTPTGEVLDALDLRRPLVDRFDVPVFVANDCSASALGEWHFGARDEYETLAHLTFGTGIGGGVVEDGRLLRGESGQAGEFGLLPVAMETGLASTGVTGAWEACCSGRGIPQYVTHRFRDADARPETTLAAAIEDGTLSAPDVFAAADDGDGFAQTCLDRIDRYNAAGIGALCNAYEPGRITLGGGVLLGNAERVLAGIEAHLDEFCFVDRPSICRTPLGDDIGLYGALGVARERTAEEVSLAAARPVAETDD